MNPRGFSESASPKEANEEEHIFKIETITGPDGSEVSYCPERGGIITSIKLKDKEILFLDEETLKDPKVNVRGGIPILFPNAGPITASPEFPNLEQHGFARKSAWRAENVGSGFKETLLANEETKSMYPHDFRLSVAGQLEADSSFTIDCEVANIAANEELPLAMGLHPYFKVPNEEKNNIKFNFTGGEIAEEQVETWANGKAVSIDNPKVKDPEAVVKIEIPSLGILIIDASAEYEKIWVWSQTGKDFICVEPVMRNKNGLVDDPEKVKPKATFSASVNFRLE